MNLIINGLIILFLGWLLARKIMPVKGVKQMTHNELKKVISERN
jgi:hypothetical protein